MIDASALPTLSVVYIKLRRYTPSTLDKYSLSYSLRCFLHICLVGVQVLCVSALLRLAMSGRRLPAIPRCLELRSEAQGKPMLHRCSTFLQAAFRTEALPPTSASAELHPPPFGSILVGGSQSSLNLWLRRRVARSLRSRPLCVRRRLRSPALTVVLPLLLELTLLPSLFSQRR